MADNSEFDDTSARLGAEASPPPTDRVCAFSKPQNRHHLKGTAKFAGNGLSTCCVEQKGSQLSCPQV